MEIGRVDGKSTIINLKRDGSGLTKVSSGNTTSFDSIKYEDKFSFLYVVPSE
jgi:hypothetical protein